VTRQGPERIVGYTIFNDWLARDRQRLEGQLPFGFLRGRTAPTEPRKGCTSSKAPMHACGVVK
jgi:2-keto-4-pentenoate hydratase/2-oxohepta-3-ene-1,7-dioic acid hydratase in catechol pathway